MGLDGNFSGVGKRGGLPHNPAFALTAILLLSSARAVHGDSAMVASEVDLKMHSARNERWHARAVRAVLKGHNSEFGKAL